MELTAVTGSSQVAAIGHDEAKRELHVRFHSGDTYHDVPGTVARTVIQAPSVGSALHQHVKKAGFRFTKHG